MDLPDGFIELHLYDYKNVLRPRGGKLKKESLSAYILDRLEGLFESWTDERYGDNPEVTELIAQLQTNMREEVDEAWREFFKRINTKNQ